MMADTERIARLVINAVSSFSLSLSDKVVYTEAATGAFASTAPAAAAAGAQKVYAIAQDSSYGSRREAIEETRRVCTALGVKDSVVFPEQKQESDIREADVITNTGFVRPISDEAISWMSPETAVPLMYEPWEFRPSDIDIASCWESGVPVVGTAEAHDRIRIFEYLGHATAKVAYKSGLELLGCTFVVIGSGSVAAEVASVLRRSGATVVIVSSTVNDDRIGRQRTFNSFEALVSSDLPDTADAFVIAEHNEDSEIIGPESALNPSALASRNASLRLIHLCGNVDSNALSDSTLRVVPSEPRPAGYMTYNAGYAGPRPIVFLHTAGLTIGSRLVDRLRAGDELSAATATVTEQPYALDFNDAFKRSHGFFD